jgi:beta-galactosidase
MRTATTRCSHVLAFLRMALLAAMAMAPFLTLLAPESDGATTALDSVSAAAATLAGRPAPTATPHVIDSGGAAPRVLRRRGRTQRHRVAYDRYSLLLDGQRVVLFGGEYQFWRTPAPARWPVILGALRAAGLNTVTVGVSWQYHSPAPGVYDFAGIRDLGRFLDDAAAAGLYVIARPGPAYNAEANASNLPGWLLAQGGNLRANRGDAYCGARAYSPVYAAAYTDWYRHVLPLIAARQITTGHGTVIALQIENEYAPQCGDTRYMRELHDLARELGIEVPLLANNNTCCVAAGSWHVAGDDGEPIVDIPAEDDYLCAGRCPAAWDSRIFHTLDGLEWRLRSAGVTQAPIAVAELQGGYFTGWGGPSYARLGQVLGPAVAEVLEGSVLGQGATIVSTYMAAGGTSWGYLAGPNTATSYDYDAAIHEWGEPSATYGALKRTGMFVQAFGDALGATHRSYAGSATNPRLLYAARQTVDGRQRGALVLVLRNADPRHGQDTRLRLPVAGRYEAVPHDPSAVVQMPPHSLALLLAGYHLGPFYLRYSTSRPLTQAQGSGAEVAVFYGVPGTPGETALAFARRPAVLHVDRGISLHYDAASQELRLNYRHEENTRYVVLAAAGQRLILVLTGPQGAQRTWRLDTPAGPALLMGPRMVAAVAAHGTTPQLRVTVRGRTPVTLWAPASGRRLAAVERATAGLAAHVSTQGLRDAGDAHRSLSLRDRRTLGLATTYLDGGRPPLSLPPLTHWRFRLESPEMVPSFDDRDWTRTDEAATNNPNVPASDTLLADDYGFHYGFVWYRGTFRGTGAERAVRLYARNSYSVWLNGRYLGSSTVHNDLKNVDDQLAIANSRPSNDTYADGLTFPIREQVKAGAVNTVAVLTESLGHNTGFANGERARSPMGLLSAQLLGPATPPAIRWKIQGGDAQPHDGVESPLNASGLYGERHGWYRTTFEDASWQEVRVPDDWASRGLHFQGVGWYRTTFDLHLPAGVDAPLGLYIPQAQDKVLIWLNGLLIGRYWDGVGPQHMFYLPAGLLHEHGHNTLALAVWNRGHRGGLTGGVSLQPYAVNGQVTLRLGR